MDFSEGNNARFVLLLLYQVNLSKWTGWVRKWLETFTMALIQVSESD